MIWYYESFVWGLAVLTHCLLSDDTAYLANSYELMDVALRRLP